MRWSLHGVAGSINSGDHVTIYSTFRMLRPRPRARQSVTVVLVPRPSCWRCSVRSSSVFGGGEEETGEQLPGTLTVTVALRPRTRSASSSRWRRVRVVRPPAAGREWRDHGADHLRPGRDVIQQQVIAVGTPQSFRAALARSLEVEDDAVGWVQSVVAAEEILVDSDHSAHVLVVPRGEGARCARPGRVRGPGRPDDRGRRRAGQVLGCFPPPCVPGSGRGGPDPRKRGAPRCRGAGHPVGRERQPREGQKAATTSIEARSSRCSPPRAAWGRPS